VRSNARSPITAILALLGTLLSGGSVLAADYSVDFGVETAVGKDAGTLTCLFGQICDAKIESLGLRVSVHVFRSEPERASVRLYGGDPSCCYFDGTADKKIIDPRKPVSRVAFFKGARAKGGLFIQNERVGTLYLKFDYR
jgi:hypothetical protein